MSKEYHLTNVRNEPKTNERRPTGAGTIVRKLPSPLSAYLMGKYGLRHQDVYSWEAEHDYDRYMVLLKDGTRLMITGMDIYRWEHRETW